LALNSLLNDIKANTGTSILLIEHDMSVVMEISDHIVVLEYGRKISDGDPTSVRTDPRVIAAYLGVDDEEVEDVLTAVGDEDVIEQLDTGPDTSHGPGASASMLAGPLSDTVVHGDGERVTVEKGASKAAQAKPASKTPAKKAAAPVAKSKPAVAKAGTAKTATASAKPAPTASAAAKPATKPAATKQAVKPEPSKAAASKPAVQKTEKAAAKPAAAKPSAAKAPATKAAAKPAAQTAAKAISNRLAAPRGGRPDDLLAINGIGPVNLRKLNEHGIFHFDQIAAWKKADIEAVEAYLAFDGRIAREDWIGQAKALDKKAASAAAAKRGGRK
jgi:branched-chain amino acid transport system ATP-binding protein